MTLPCKGKCGKYRVWHLVLVFGCQFSAFFLFSERNYSSSLVKNAMDALGKKPPPVDWAFNKLIYLLVVGTEDPKYLRTGQQKGRPSADWETLPMLVVAGRWMCCMLQLKGHALFRHNGKPYKPALHGIENFGGPVIHSSEYRVPERFANKSVLVVGGMVSANDISCQLLPVAKKVSPWPKMCFLVCELKYLGALDYGQQQNPPRRFTGEGQINICISNWRTK